MRILAVMLKYPPDFTGAGLRLHRMFVRMLRKGEIDGVDVLTSWDRPENRRVQCLDDIRIFRAVEDTGKAKYEQRGKRLKKWTMPFKVCAAVVGYLLLQRKADLVLTAGAGWLPTVAAWLSLLTGKPFAKELILLGSDDPLTVARDKSIWTRWFFMAPFWRASLVICISPQLQAACLSAGLPKEKLWMRFNPVDFETALHDAPAIDLISSEDCAPVILWVGSVSARKNVEFLLEAGCRLKGPATLLFVGPCYDVEYLKELHSIAARLPSGVRAEFPGLMTDTDKLAGLYRRANLFWFASHKEGMANVVAESLVCGTPVVTLPVQGIMQEMLESPEDGVVVDTVDPGEFARVVEAWLAQRHDRSSISKRARKRFDAVTVDAAYGTYFRGMVERKAGRPISRFEPAAPQQAHSDQRNAASDGGKRPFFSVVLAVYNGMPFLPEALESVLAQTETDWEFIVVDDASTDETPAILSAFAARDKRIRVVRNAFNRHFGASLNIGIAQARGRWIARIDADDRHHPHFLNRVRAFVTGIKKEPFFISTWTSVIDEHGEKILDIRLPEGRVIQRMMPVENFIYHVATVFSAALFEKSGGYPENLKKGIDRALWNKFFNEGAKLCVIPEVLADYRIHDTNLTSLARRSKRGAATLARQQREWHVSLYLKQKMTREARAELLVLAHESGWSFKNRAYFFLSYLPPSLLYFMMWEVRSHLRSWFSGKFD